MAIHESGENYLEAIYLLSREQEDVHSVDIARRMNVSQPTITKSVKKLVRDGYLTTRGVHLCLTDKGHKKAEEVYEKHTVISAFWVKLGVSERSAEADACRMEHIVSDEVFAAMKKFIGKEEAADANDVSTKNDKKG